MGAQLTDSDLVTIFPCILSYYMDFLSKWESIMLLLKLAHDCTFWAHRVQLGLVLLYYDLFSVYLWAFFSYPLWHLLVHLAYDVN